MKTLPGLVGFAAVLLATGAYAGTKFQMNIVPTASDCFIGGNCLNVSSSCSDPGGNSDCVLGTLSPKSMVKLDGKRHLKGTVKGVTDNTGALMTTGPAETATDNLVLKLSLTNCLGAVDSGSPCNSSTPTTSVYLKVVLTNGKGKLKVDLSTVAGLGAAGAPIAVSGVSVLGAPGNPGDCPGTNSATDVATRLNDATCESSSVVRGVGGVVLE